MIGLMLGAATIAVAMIGGFVVNDHLNGRLQLDDKLDVAIVHDASTR
jgi:hypothetical protein